MIKFKNNINMYSQNLEKVMQKNYYIHILLIDFI